MPAATTSVPARAGLVGHPSDGYGGATLAVTLHNFAAEVTVAHHDDGGALDVAPATDGEWPEGGRPLIAATVARFAATHANAGLDPATIRIRYRSTIPRQLGLGGSSALVVATLRALAQLTGTTIPLADLPALALSVERDELGIAAGLQDRVVQSHGGLVFMDFATAHVEPLPPDLLPALFVAWRPGAGGSSGTAHADVRARFDAGDPAIRGAMDELATLARDARTALVDRDDDGFAAALQAGYDVRARIFDLDPRHTALVDAARAHGLPATYTGSGGAIVGIAHDPDAVARLRSELAAAHGAELAPALTSAA